MKAISGSRATGVDVVAAVCAGVAAGILATVVQIVLWAIFTDALPAVLYRDSRFAAAIVLGRGVLPPPASFDERIMLVATLVHFALAIAYAITLAWLIANLRVWPSLLAGAAFGLGLYAINMYGFSALFPWFASSRDWITAAAHLAFGVALAGVYRLAARARRG
ncbi:MAG TPA: sodium:proline symporter [Casimicrobiaceae bacterium]|nr:sodium:proline symporter [Casimicrobiaceae bacterium]